MIGKIDLEMRVSETISEQTVIEYRDLSFNARVADFLTVALIQLRYLTASDCKVTAPVPVREPIPVKCTY